MPLVHLAGVELLLLDIWAWGLVHLSTGYLVHKVPAARLGRDTWLFRPRRFERGGRLYVGTFRILRWKDKLPEAGAMFAGGISKRRLLDDEAGGLPRFAVETRRAELTHWLAMLPGPLFALWNPGYVVPVMVAYGVLVNLPFVMIQRCNRQRIDRILAGRAARAATA